MSSGIAEPEEIRFWNKVNKNGPLVLGRFELGPCWIWLGKLNKDGYGNFAPARKIKGVPSNPVLAHRWAWVDSNGPIALEFEIDHLCHSLVFDNCLSGSNCFHRSCVNPMHMELVTHLENVGRGNAGINMKTKTHCPQGHVYSYENTFLYSTGSRGCIQCRSDSRRVPPKASVFGGFTDELLEGLEA